jgi:hypothetical protein
MKNDARKFFKGVKTMQQRQATIPVVCKNTDGKITLAKYLTKVTVHLEMPEGHGTNSKQELILPTLNKISQII